MRTFPTYGFLELGRRNFGDGIQPGSLGSSGSVPFSTKIAALNPFLWWKLNELSGTTITDYGSVGKNATFTAGGGALGAAGIGDGGTSITFDGTATQVAGATGAMTLPAAGTIMVWCKFASGIWTDGANRTIRFDRTDSQNYARLGRPAGNNSLVYVVEHGNTGGQITLAATPTTDWFLFAGTWNTSGTSAYQILKGGTVGASDETGVAVGTWAAGSAVWQMGFAAQFMKGDFAHMIILPSKLTQAQLVDLAMV